MTDPGAGANAPGRAHATAARRSGFKSATTLIALVGAFLALQSLLPLKSANEIGADEGFELAKATLALKGYQLYTEVWNDQPPLHTFLITQILKRVSPSILGPRLLTTGFTLILLTSVFLISHRISGLMVAGLTVALLIASPGFIELSSSCMLEIPSLAMAVAALGVLQICRPTRWRIGEILSGALFGIAFQMKLVTIILLPLAALIIWLRHRESVLQGGAGVPPAARSSRESCVSLFRSLSLLVASLAFSFAAIDCAIDRGAFLLHFQQSWSSHFAPAKSFEYGSPNDRPFDWSVLLKNWDTTVPAVVGIVFLGRMRGTPAAILPLGWLILMLAVFATHKPWWSYYYIHSAIPLCWCAAIGLEAIWKRSRLRRSIPLYVLLGVFGIFALGWMSSRVYFQVTGIRGSPQTYSSLVLGEIERLKPFVDFIYTDESIYSFHAGIPMPPNLAVLPLKRFWSGDMTNDRVAEEMWAVKPEVILLRNDTREVPFQDLIDAEYRVVYQDADHRLYTKKSLAKQAGY